MADWTTIPDSSIEPGKPIRSIDGLALRDNPIAITEGAAGAPRNTDASLSTTATNTGRDWVLARNALSDVGAVGTYAFLGETSLTTTAPGSTRAGSSLRYVGGGSFLAWQDSGNQAFIRANNAYGNTPSGTWRCMGHSQHQIGGGDISNVYPATLWLRIS
jgi:hypothetical protein